MAATYSFAGHVKVVGIVEIVLQVLYCIAVFALAAMLVLGVGLISPTKGKYYYGSRQYGHTLITPRDAGLSDIFITIVVILAVVMVFEGWLVYLVFTGGRKKKASRLTIWYIIQSVFTSIQILLMIIYVALVGPGWSIILDILYLLYRIYSIHVVRSHAEEINE